MHPADIKAALSKAGWTQAKVARQLGLSKMTICHVVRGTSKSAKVARAISAATGIPVGTLWPNKYKRTAFLEATGQSLSATQAMADLAQMLKPAGASTPRQQPTGAAA
jgi:putative transcriptional regulator